jgi:protein ImuB
MGMPLAEAVALLERPVPPPGSPRTASPTGTPTGTARPPGTVMVSGLGSRQGSCQEKILQVEPHDAQADLQALRELAGWCQRFSPVVGWQVADLAGGRQAAKGSRRVSPAKGTGGTDCLLLDVTAVGPLFGDEWCLAEQVVEEFWRRGYRVRAAIAGTVGAAWAVARFGLEGSQSASSQPASSQSASSQSAREKVAGQRDRRAAAAWVVPVGADRAALAGLPIEALRLEPEQRRLLRQLGLERVEQLLLLKRESLAARLGEGLLLRLDQALGAVEELIDVPRTPPDFQARWQAEHPLEDRRLVEEVLWRLLRQVTAALAARDQGVVRLQCALDCLGGPPLRLQIGLFRPTAEAEHVMELVRLQLERLALPGPVRQVQVAALLTAPREHQQQRLFAEQARDAGLPVARLVDRLSSRLGKQSVLRPVPQADAQPEHACRYEDWTGGRAVGGKHRESGGSKKQAGGPEKGAGIRGGSAGLRPLRLFCPAPPLQVVAVAPDGPPIRVYWRQWLPVVQFWGPERIETGWWRGRAVRRDYYRIETSIGSRFWIYRQREDGQWFLHGEFV